MICELFANELLNKDSAYYYTSKQMAKYFKHFIHIFMYNK